MFRLIMSAILRKPNVILMKLKYVLHFHQEYIGFPEDGAHNDPKHVRARLYTNIWIFECIYWGFFHRMKNAWSKLQNIFILV
jgi:hypothetical protein